MFNCLSKRWGFLNIIRSTQIVFMFTIWKKWNTVWRNGHKFDYTKLWNILKSSVLSHTNKCNRNFWQIVTSLGLVRNIKSRVMFLVLSRCTFWCCIYVTTLICFRYKFFLGSSLGATFMNIGDDYGMGHDHCELVGGSENNGVPAEYNSTPPVYGKYIYEGWSEIIEIFILLFPWKSTRK